MPLTLVPAWYNNNIIHEKTHQITHRQEKQKKFLAMDQKFLDIFLDFLGDDFFIGVSAGGRGTGRGWTREIEEFKQKSKPGEGH